MLKFINTLVLAMFLIPQVSNTFLWVHYELNKKAITEEFCVNKEQPELQCNGKCHLVEQLTPESAPETNEPVEVNYLPQLTLFFEGVINAGILNGSQSAESFYAPHAYSCQYKAKIEHPPRA